MTDGSLRPLLSVGEILVDLIVADGANSLAEASLLAIRAGGAPANAAASIARMGLPVGFCGVVGNDQFGERLRQTLESRGVNASTLRSTDEAATTIALAWKSQDGDGHFQILPGADTLLSPGDVAAADIAGRSALVIGSVSLASEPARSAIYNAVELAQGFNVPVVCDVNVRPNLWSDLGSVLPACEPLLRGSTLVKLSLDDAHVLFGDNCSPAEAIHQVIRYGLPHVVVTDGERGAWFAGESEPVVHVPAFAVEVTDPTGAGDAFTGALLSRVLERNWKCIERDDVLFASAAGAITATRAGGIEGIPGTAEIAEFLAMPSPTNA